MDTSGREVMSFNAGCTTNDPLRRPHTGVTGVTGTRSIRRRCEKRMHRRVGVAGSARRHMSFSFVLLLQLQLLPLRCDASAPAAPLDCAAMDLQNEGGPELSSPVVINQVQHEEEEDGTDYAFGTPGPKGFVPTPEPSVTVKTQPPSLAPSVAQPCSDPLSNARGDYTSTLAPCVVKFHNANLQREGREIASSSLTSTTTTIVEEGDFINYRTSDLCTEENVIIQIQEYVQSWPDECVGDFERCYSLEHHFPLLCDFLCEKQAVQYDYLGGIIPYHQHQSPRSSSSYRPHWELPEGTTHVSVTCTRDKELVIEQIEKEERAEREGRRQAKRDAIQTRLFNGIIVFISALTIIFALSQLIITPLVTVANKIAASSGRNPYTTSRYDCDDYDHDDNDYRSIRRNQRRGSSFLERRSSSISSLPLHSQVAEPLALEDDHVVHGSIHTREIEQASGDGSSSMRSPRDVGGPSGRRRRPYTVEDDDDISGRSQSSHQSDDQAERDFASQIPLDFDAIPIAAIPVVPAVVLNDGITY